MCMRYRQDQPVKTVACIRTVPEASPLLEELMADKEEKVILFGDMAGDDPGCGPLQYTYVNHLLDSSC